MRALLALAALAVLAGCAQRSQVAPLGCASESEAVQAHPPEPVTFATGDGVDLHGSWQRGVDDTQAAVLVHGLGEDRRAWQPLADALNRKGLGVLAFDLRGHGASTLRRGEPYELGNFTEADFRAMQQDVAAAVELVRGRSDPACIALVGASLGANLALRAGAEKRGPVDAVAMLSPGIDYRGVRTDDALALPRWGDAPLWLGASKGDTYSAESARTLSDAARNDTLVLVEGSAHGTGLLADQRLLADLVAWLVRAA